MFLSSINLRNIRRHTDNRIDFTDNLNYIIGGNGVGKTSVLEAIYYLSTTKSCLTSSDAEVVKLGEKDFNIEGNIQGLTNDKVQVSYSKVENKKTYILNTKKISKFSKIIGKFPVVLLSPSDHTITQGYPADRRRFVDSVISQASRTYLNIVIEYNRVLKQRAFLLSRLRETGIRKDSELDAWNEKLVSIGIEIIKYRDQFVKDFIVYVEESYQKILSDKEIPGIEYFFLEGSSMNGLESFFIEQLDKKAEEEIRRGVNLVGPHKDDFVFNINSINLKSYGSQGQHKTFQTVLRFAEYFYLKDKKKHAPIFLLDDVFGELDSERAAAISRSLKEVGQAMITLTDFGNISHLKIDKEDRIIKLSSETGISYE